MNLKLNVAPIVGGLIVVLAAPAYAGPYASFSRPTDTISVAGNVSFTNQATYEATILMTSAAPPNPPPPLGPEANVFNSWQYGAQDDYLALAGGTINAYAFPVNYPVAFTGGTPSIGVWHDVAYVYDGSQERLYLDGNLIVSRAASGNLEIGPSNTMVVGAIFRGGGIASSILGDIGSVRISNVARYSGSSYTATFADFTTDSSTELLYNFDQVPAGATTIADLSGNGHFGTPGIGFSGATSPTFGAVPDPGGASLLCIGAIALLLGRFRLKALKEMPEDAN